MIVLQPNSFGLSLEYHIIRSDGVSSSDWINEVSSGMDKDDFTFFITGYWSLWYRGNKFVFENVDLKP